MTGRRRAAHGDEPMPSPRPVHTVVVLLFLCATSLYFFTLSVTLLLYYTQARSALQGQGDRRARPVSSGTLHARATSMG